MDRFKHDIFSLQIPALPDSKQSPRFYGGLPCRKLGSIEGAALEVAERSRLLRPGSCLSARNASKKRILLYAWRPRFLILFPNPEKQGGSSSSLLHEYAHERLLPPPGLLSLASPKHLRAYRCCLACLVPRSADAVRDGRQEYHPSGRRGGQRPLVRRVDSHRD